MRGWGAGPSRERSREGRGVLEWAILKEAAALEVEEIDAVGLVDHLEGELEEADFPGVVDAEDDGGEGVIGGAGFGEDALGDGVKKVYEGVLL